MLGTKIIETSERPRLELRGISKSYDGVEAVKNLDLSLARGEFLSLLGPSGCGKSTTLSMIAGFLTPDSGDILVHGDIVNRVPPQKRRIGLVFQDYAVFSRLSVRGNLAFGLEAQGVPRAERQQRIADMAAKLDLGPILERLGGALNMSEMQRVALARVLVTRPALLLLDEPMSNLDAALRATLRTELKRIQKDLDQTVLYVTHDQVEAMAMSDRIAVMQGGRLLQVGTPGEIYHRPVNRFVAEFIGDPPINVINCEVSESGGELTLRTALHGPGRLGKADISPGHHLLAIRPHDLRIGKAPGRNAAVAIVRFIENFGAEHVVHLEYGDELIAVTAAPHFVDVGERVYLELPFDRAHLIDAASERVVTKTAQNARVEEGAA